MSTKKDNRITFFSEQWGEVELVKKSLGRYRTNTWVFDEYRQGMVKVTHYYRGQLAHDWNGFSKGRVIWLNMDDFRQRIKIESK